MLLSESTAAAFAALMLLLGRTGKHPCETVWNNADTQRSFWVNSLQRLSVGTGMALQGTGLGSTVRSHGGIEYCRPKGFYSHQQTQDLLDKASLAYGSNMLQANN